MKILSALKQFFIIVTAIAGLIIVGNLYANERHKSIIDIYGTNQLSVEEVRSKFAKDFTAITKILFSKNPISSLNQNSMVNYLVNIQQELNKMGSFAYVNISPILYPGKPNVYYTIDLVDKDDIKRSSIFLSKPTQSFADPDKLIATWRSYEKLVFDDFMVNKTKYSAFNCSAYHCLENNYLAQFNPMFTKLVPRNQSKLVAILRNDKNPENRAAAAYLLAYVENGDSLIKDLVPSMKDGSVEVRNSTMRVLAYALSNKLPHADFPVKEVIAALDYPAATDRNKALYMLQGLVLQHRYAIYLKEHAKVQLLTQLHMLQPNVHDLSYDILKKMSGMKYGDRDYKAWENWLNSTHGA